MERDDDARNLFVTPAKAGVSCRELMSLMHEIPAFAGMTEKEGHGNGNNGT